MRVAERENNLEILFRKFKKKEKRFVLFKIKIFGIVFGSPEVTGEVRRVSQCSAEPFGAYQILRVGDPHPLEGRL